MAKILRTALFGKLNPLAFKAAESASVFCKLRNNPDIELAHWIHQILQIENSDLRKILGYFSISNSALAADVIQYLDTLPVGARGVMNFSPDLEEAIERAWVIASLAYNTAHVRTGHLMLGILQQRQLSNVLFAISDEFKKIRRAELEECFDAILDGSAEDNMAASDGFAGGARPGESSGATAPAPMGKGEALAQYTHDLTRQARDGKIDPIVGRDEEIRQMVDILMRRRQNNPILTGEAGVGKTAVVEGFAHRIASGDVPPPLRNVSILSLDIGLLQAGASMKGEFENRLQQVIDEVQSSETPIILFIDEAHTLIGAGGQAGTGDAANLLKPALARGDLRTVAATTWAEYKKHIEKDPALTRRFQVIQVEEPSEEKAILMMRNMASMMESHHKVQILDEAIEACVRLSHRYIPARQLPDKSVSLLDTSCARVAVSQYAVPADVDDCRKRIQALETELTIIEKEASLGVDADDRRTNAQKQLRENLDLLDTLEGQWLEEKSLVDQILQLRAELRKGAHVVEGTGSKLETTVAEIATETAADALEGGFTDGDVAKIAAESAHENTPEQRTEALQSLRSLQERLAQLQGETPLILLTVDAQAVGTVVQDWTGIPVGRMVKNELETVMNLASIMGARIIGQDHALETIAKRIQTSRASLDNPNKPIGVFMLAGTSGVGKTETALALAEALYGGEQNIITINMSEYQEAHTVSSLKGAPPGYVGYGEGGVLTEAVRRKPYSVILLDEVEKAHPDVHEIFFQVFDKGMMEDGEGRTIDFKNTLILLTTNAGTDLIKSLCNDPDLMPAPEGINKALREPLLKQFPPALLGRLVTIPYFPLNDDMLREIAKIQLKRVQSRVAENHDVALTYNDDVLKLIVGRCTEQDSGGRMIDSILTNTVLPTMSGEIINRMIDGESIASIEITVTDDTFAYDFA
ncbi:Protein ClpV1 [BD1-7 clade bacterium]|uniref:Protein ClpV1 n=1 Tax=BD1-7 clade bacterium TaxID=2029982 RepID=A0A5S9QEB7_9GAMM|nr:Protein ClpV1 [BD1-7 clade bacterium]CAA0116222.1 Protein ClpV1 [BD1-7 clade bacterium]CAA0119893.1 Protein ClpV1 [BD1-7 clade bacterium]